MKKGTIVILGLLVFAQFIQPKKNKIEKEEQYYINLQRELSIPNDTHHILRTACYDCHSNNTNYNLWYRSITPINFWINHHIEEGKEHFNFSELNKYSPEKRVHKLREFVDEIEHDKMPIKAYTITHKKAKLTVEQKEILINWAKEQME